MLPLASTAIDSAAALMRVLFDRMHHADANDFAMLSVAVVVTVWYVNRYLGD